MWNQKVKMVKCGPNHSRLVSSLENRWFRVGYGENSHKDKQFLTLCSKKICFNIVSFFYSFPPPAHTSQGQEHSMMGIEFQEGKGRKENMQSSSQVTYGWPSLESEKRKDEEKQLWPTSLCVLHLLPDLHLCETLSKHWEVCKNGGSP